jgi:hypothetical protein
MKLNNIVVAKKDQEQTVVIPVETKNGDDSAHTENLTVVYRPLTQKVLNLILAGNLAEGLALILVDADLQDEAGNKIEPTVEFLSDQPFEFLVLLSEHISGDIAPKKKR